MVLIEAAGAGDIISMAGLASPSIGHTIANTEVLTQLMFILQSCTRFKPNALPLSPPLFVKSHLRGIVLPIIVSFPYSSIHSERLKYK